MRKEQPEHRWLLKSVKPTRSWANVGRRNYVVTITNRGTVRNAKGYTEHEFLVIARDRMAARAARAVIGRKLLTTADQIIDLMQEEARRP